ncbi:MAG: hypothetical protein Q7S17_05165 [Xanthobacteraceae bacterium]|nr:hypothetical protein [Xanthobacteraceae bacterium]
MTDVLDAARRLVELDSDVQRITASLAAGGNTHVVAERKRDSAACETGPDIARALIAAEKAAEALRVILPMAKGYAYAYTPPRGNNVTMVEEAEADLAAYDDAVK